MPDSKKPLNFAQALRARPAQRVEEAPAKVESTPAVTPVVTPVITVAPTPVATPVERTEPRPQSLDATHTTSEGMVYSNMYRLTISKGIRERHFGPKELAQLTGIRSDRTIRTAIDGLIAKRSVEIIWQENGYPLGPKYRVFEPREVMKRRRDAGIEIDIQTKQIITPVATPVIAGVDAGGDNYPGTPAKTTPVTPVNFAGDTINNNVLNPIGKKASDDDDEGFAPLLAAAVEITGKEVKPNEWRELAEVLAAELKIAAGRTTVSSAPAFFAEHLRRRLWKKEKRQIEAEAAEQKMATAVIPLDASKCPDCFGTGMWYPEGYEKGVAKCQHEKLSADVSQP